MKTVIKFKVPLYVTSDDILLWTIVAKCGNVKLLKCMIKSGIVKDSIDQNGYSIFWHAVSSGNIEAVCYLLDLGVAISAFAPEEREEQCEQCEENRLILDDEF